MPHMWQKVKLSRDFGSKITALQMARWIIYLAPLFFPMMGIDDLEVEECILTLEPCFLLAEQLGHPYAFMLIFFANELLVILRDMHSQAITPHLIRLRDKLSRLSGLDRLDYGNPEIRDLCCFIGSLLAWPLLDFYSLLVLVELKLFLELASVFCNSFYGFLADAIEESLRDKNSCLELLRLILCHA